MIAQMCLYAVMYIVSGQHKHVIATILREIGRHNDALVLQKEVVDFYQRVLPHNDPRIGNAAQCSAFRAVFAVICNDVMTGRAMHDLGRAYGVLNRHADSLIVREKTLEFRRLHLPENHPDIGVAADKMDLNPTEFVVGKVSRLHR